MGVVGVRVVDGLGCFHRVRGRLLFRQVYYNIGHEFLECLEKGLLFFRNVDFLESDAQGSEFLPPGDPGLDVLNWTDAAIPVLLINLSSCQIIDNEHLVTQLREA